MYREAAGYYNEAAKEGKVRMPNQLPVNPPGNTRSPTRKSPFRSNSLRKPNVPPTSPLFKVHIQQVLIDEKSLAIVPLKLQTENEPERNEVQTRGGNDDGNGEELIQTTDAGHYFIEMTLQVLMAYRRQLWG